MNVPRSFNFLRFFPYPLIKTYIDFMLNQEEYFSDSVRHAEGGTVVLVRSTDWKVACSSPTQRKCFVCNYCLAGARPLDNIRAAAKFDNTGYNFSYTFNQDGSKSLNLGVNANIPIETPWVYLEINMGLGFSMNSYSESTLSTHGGLCVGYATACAGVENGGSLYWDRGGSFMGATVYAGVYASLGYGAARVSAGYEAGLFGMEGRGMYVGASAGGLYAEYAQNGGWNYGGALSTEILNYDSENGLDYIGKEFVDALLADDDIDYPEKGDDLQKKGKWGNTNYCGAVPRPLSFLKSTSSQTSSLVLIFSKKAGFSLTKVNKVAVPRPLSFLKNYLT